VACGVAVDELRFADAVAAVEVVGDVLDYGTGWAIAVAVLESAIAADECDSSSVHRRGRPIDDDPPHQARWD
jgi:hypothetical protein